MGLLSTEPGNKLGNIVLNSQMMPASPSFFSFLSLCPLKKEAVDLISQNFPRQLVCVCLDATSLTLITESC